MSEVQNSKTKQFQYIPGVRFNPKVYHVVAANTVTTLETGCGHIIEIANTNRKLTKLGAAPPEGMRLCKKCEEALLWWRFNGTWRKR